MQTLRVGKEARAVPDGARRRADGLVLRSHLLAGVCFGRYGGTNELEPAKELRGSIPGDSLTILDRGFLAAAMLLGIETGGYNRHWLTRAKASSKWRVLSRLGKGDELVEMETLLTSLLDAKRHPADEIVALYHERWELELEYDELKTELLEREETIRSKRREGVEQELWGILLV